MFRLHRSLFQGVAARIAKYLRMLVEGRLDSSMRTPHPLTAEEIKILRLRVDQGAKSN